MKVVLFTDTLMGRDKYNQPYAVRDQFVRFITRIAAHGVELELVARCDPIRISTAAAEPLRLDRHLSFSGLPCYASSEQFYRHLVPIVHASRPLIRDAVRRADVIVLRVHHCLAALIAVEAKRARKPQVMYWAGPAISESTRRNYPGRSLKHWTARAIATLEERLYRRLARDAALHFFIDQNEHTQMGSPSPVRWLRPNLVCTEDIVAVPARRDGSSLRLIFAGRLVEHKGVQDLLSAVAEVHRAGVNVELDIAGDGPVRPAIKERISELNLETRVRLHGQVALEEVRSMMRNAHVFVLPSYAESFPKVIWEAWAAGLAVITTPVGNIATICKDGDSALLVPPNQPTLLAQAINRLGNDERLRWNLAAKGMTILGAATWDSQITSIVDGLRLVSELSANAASSAERSAFDAISELG